jgi:hypothetical protein
LIDLSKEGNIVAIGVQVGWYGVEPTRPRHSVDLSCDGMIVAIGAGFNDGNGDTSGHVRVFKWDGTVWNQLGTDIDGEAGRCY